MTNEKLIEIAKDSKKNSYSPYSDFGVGAALLTKDGKVFTGTNIENASYSLTVCAERVAIFKAISEGAHEFEKIAIIGEGEDYCYPCGACRQVLNEFCDDDFKIIVESKGSIKECTLKELLPYSFTLKEVDINEND